MKYINNYEDYLREYKQFINHENSENMNEGVKHWLATFLMLVNLGIVPPAVMASGNDEVKKEFVQDKETLDMVASKFKTYYNQNDFYNTPEYAWGDFQKEYGTSTYDISDIVKSASLNEEVNQKIPVPTNHVNDYADIFTSDKENELNKLLDEYNKTSGMEIAIITVNTFQEKTYMSSFAQDVFDTWGVGKKGADNGILIAINEMDRDWRIQTGYGAEIVLTDAMCSRLARELMLPDLANDNFEEGITKIVHGIIEYIGDDSAEIEQFKEDYKKAKAEKLEKVKDTFVNTVIILALLALLGLLLSIIIKKSNEKRKIKERSKGLLADINILINDLEDELKGSDKLEYLKSIRNDLTEYVNSVDDLPDTPTSNQELVDKLFQYTKTLGEMITKAKTFNRYYVSALGTDEIVKSAKGYLTSLNNINKELSKYGIQSSNKVTVKNLDDMGEIVKKYMGTEKIFSSLDRLKDLSNSARSSLSYMMSVEANIPTMKDKLNNYKKHVEIWISDLKKYGLSKYEDDVKTKVSGLETLLNLPEGDLFKKFKKYEEIQKFVEGIIDDEKNRLRRIKEEKERKERRKRDEEEAAARRRRNSYSSSSSSYGGGFGSSSSSSSFGGFGGGSSGGGGAGGRF